MFQCMHLVLFLYYCLEKWLNQCVYVHTVCVNWLQSFFVQVYSGYIGLFYLCAALVGAIEVSIQTVEKYVIMATDDVLVHWYIDTGTRFVLHV